MPPLSRGVHHSLRLRSIGLDRGLPPWKRVSFYWRSVAGTYIHYFVPVVSNWMHSPFNSAIWPRHLLPQRTMFYGRHGILQTTSLMGVPMLGRAHSYACERLWR